jgi:hypothetical protein
VPAQDALEAYGGLKVPKELWIFENQYHPWGTSNLHGMDDDDYVTDWLNAFFGRRIPTKAGPLAYVLENGDGPWSQFDCAGPGQNRRTERPHLRPNRYVASMRSAVSEPS